MPKVGPMDGCRMATVARLPMNESAWPKPTVVVVLPSPSGVGVIAETTTYLAFGRYASSSMASSRILATSYPYGSRRCGPMPILAAISGMGKRRARRAMSRSDGNVTAKALSFSGGQQTGQRLLAPALGGLDLVEGEEMQTHDLALRRGQVRKQSAREALGIVPAGLDHAHEPVGVAAQEPGRIGEADARGDAQELGGIGHSGEADVDGQLHAATPDAGDPSLHGPRVEAEIADDVGGEAPLVPHRLDREVVLDEAVPFRITGDTDLAKAVRLGADRLQQRHRVRELPGRLLGIARHDEHLAPADGGDPGQHLIQVRLVSDQARGNVRDDLVAVLREPLREGDCGVDASARRGGDREGHLFRHVGYDELLDGFGWKHLVARFLQKGDEALAAGFVGESDATQQPGRRPRTRTHAPAHHICPRCRTIRYCRATRNAILPTSWGGGSRRRRGPEGMPEITSAARRPADRKDHVAVEGCPSPAGVEAGDGHIARQLAMQGRQLLRLDGARRVGGAIVVDHRARDGKEAVTGVEQLDQARLARPVDER